MKIVAIVGSPAAGKTSAAAEAVLAGARAHGAGETPLYVLGHDPATGAPPERAAVLEAMRDADGFVLATPMYRATYTGQLKALLDEVPRAMYGSTEAPLTARPVAVVGTGASAHHFLGIDPLVAFLVRFFGAYVVPPAFYADATSFDDAGALREAPAAAAHALGAATAALAAAVGASPALAAAAPQA
ncbi:MAG: reductase [Solirubrobacteraceae bacterium]|nr:reductase [Solirubrobacteraceae bacterium]